MLNIPSVTVYTLSEVNVTDGQMMSFHWPSSRMIISVAIIGRHRGSAIL